MKHKHLDQNQFQINYIFDFKLKLKILYVCLNCMLEMIWDWSRLDNAKTNLAQYEAWQSSNEVWKDARIIIQSLGHWRVAGVAWGWRVAEVGWD